MNGFGLSKLKISRDRSGNYWIAEYSEHASGTSSMKLRDNTLQAMGEIAEALANLDCSDWKLKRDIYIAFIGLLGRWVSSWRDPLADMAIKAVESDELGADFSPESSEVCVGNIRAIETIQSILSVIDNDVFRKALGGSYEELPEKHIEELKHLLYELASAVIGAHEINAKAENE